MYMSIDYNVSQEGKLITAYPKGTLDRAQTIDYFNRIAIDSNIKPGAVEVVNFKDVTEYKISHQDSTAITEWYQRLKSSQAISKTIFVCETNLAYGIGRMLQSVHQIENPEHEVIVVKSEAELKTALAAD